MNLHLFVGVRETYHKPSINVAAATYFVDEDAYHVAYASEDKTPVELLGIVLPRILNDIDKLDSRAKDSTMRVIINKVSDWDSAMLERLINAAHINKVVEACTDNKTMANREEWLAIAKAVKVLRDSKIKFTTKHKETPNVVKEAIICDSIAAQAVEHTLQNPNNGLECGSTTPKDRKLKAKPLPSLICDKYLFNWMPTQEVSIYCTCNTELENKKPKAKKSDPIKDKGFVYYGGDNKRLRIAGRMSAQDRYNVVILKKPCDFLEGIFEYQNKINSKIYSTRQAVMYRIQSLTSGGVGNRLEAKDFSMVGSTYRGDLYTLTAPRIDLSYVFNPPRLAFKIKRIMEANLSKLNDYISGNYHNFNVKDITDEIYMFDDKGKCKLRPYITNDTKNLVIKNVDVFNGDSITIKPLIKYDMPTRNELARIGRDNPKVTLVTWEFDPHIVGYSFIFETNDGWLYYSSEYGSRHLLRTARKSQRKEK